jgi:hypothetical protein
MYKIKTVKYQLPVDLLGKHVHMFLKGGRDFGFKVTGCGEFHLEGKDDEQRNLTLALTDIDFILGG